MSASNAFPQGPLIDQRTGLLALEWVMWLQNPNIQSLTVGGNVIISSSGAVALPALAQALSGQVPYGLDGENGEDGWMGIQGPKGDQGLQGIFIPGMDGLDGDDGFPMPALGTGMAPLADSGLWTTPAFSSGDFTASGAMTWTVDSGDVTTYQWMKIGKSLTVNFNLGSTTVGGTPSSSLQIKIPGGYASAKRVIVNSLYVNQNGTYSVGAIDTGTAGSTILTLYQTTSGANWTATTNATGVSGSITFEIQ